MSSYASYLNGYRGFVGNPFLKWKQGIDALYERSHGGLRYTLSQLPITGKFRQFNDTVRQWEDSYNQTGRDPNYSTRYGSGGIPFVNDALNGLGLAPVKMAKHLAQMYGCEVELNLVKEKKELEQMRAVNRYNYAVGSHALAEHWMDYQRMKYRS